MSQQLLYYRHSGAVSPGGVVLTLTVGVALGVVGGVIYAAFELLCNLIIFKCLATVLFGLFLSLGLQQLLSISRIRNRLIVWVAVAVVCAAVVWAMWTAWVYGILLMHAPFQPPLWQIIVRPDLLWRMIVELNRVGVWSLPESMIPNPARAPHEPVNGVALWVVWLVEAALVVGPSLYMARRDSLNKPYCEKCRTWCKQLTVITYQATDTNKLREHLLNRDFAYLSTLNKAPDFAKIWTHLTVQGCPKCTDLRTLCVDEMEEPGVQSKRTICRPVITWLLLTSVEADRFQALADQLEQIEESTESAEPKAEG